ncbi:MAG: acyl-CoA thioesterase [Ardenticatenaceae bacterium]|nr:acyl-CoA thioesterase [Ardenticatenaceae bacterium]
MILNSSLPKVLESTAVVRFQDCDPFGHLNNARYVDYFMNARTDQLQAHYDFNIFAVGQEIGSNWVVSKTEIVFLLPALLMETVRIQTRLILATSRKLVIEGIMFDEGGQQIKAVAWVEFTFVNLANGRPASHPEELMQLFTAVQVHDIYGTTTFDERVNQLRQAQRQKRREKAQAANAYA